MNEDKNAVAYREAIQRFDRAYEWEQINFDEALDDLQFRAGEQWDEAAAREREADGRPVLTINRMPQFIRQVTGDMRQNKASIKVRGVDDQSDKEVADIYTGLIRHIENQSDAQAAYHTAADAQVACGMGHWRVTTAYTDADAFTQDIQIQRITNPFAVYWDPDAQESSKEDAMWCFVIDEMPMEEFKERWPNANVSDFEGDDRSQYLNKWYNADSVRVAEYWCKKPVKKTIAEMQDGSIVDITDMPDGIRMLMPIRRTSERKSFKVVQYIMSGAEVLEGPNDWAGQYIPIVTAVGEEVFIGDRLVRHGVIRYAKDAQRVYNYWRTAQTETVALQPRAPWLVTPKQIGKYKAMWDDANVKNYPYMFYDPDPNAASLAPKRETPPILSQALVQETAQAAEDMKATTGIYDAALGAQGNETSGKAILARQREGDTGTYVYLDNHARAVRYTGKILVDLIPKIYDTQRVVRILNEDDTEDFAEINIQFYDPMADQEYKVNDLTVGKYDILVTTGPSYSTKRVEAAESMLQFVQAVPGAAALIGDLIAKTQDWDGADEMAERLKRALPPGIAEPEEGEEPSPEQQAAQEQQSMLMQMEMAEKQSKVSESEAKAEKVRAEAEGQVLENAEKQIGLAQAIGLMEGIVTKAVSDALRQTLEPPPIPQQPIPIGAPPESGVF